MLPPESLGGAGEGTLNSPLRGLWQVVPGNASESPALGHRAGPSSPEATAGGPPLETERVFHFYSAFLFFGKVWSIGSPGPAVLPDRGPELSCSCPLQTGLPLLFKVLA